MPGRTVAIIDRMCADALFAKDYMKVERYVEGKYGSYIPRLIKSMGSGGAKVREDIDKSKEEDDVTLEENTTIAR